MGTAGPPGSFDLQNFFKGSPQSSLPGYNQPSAPYPPPNHPFHPSSHPYPPPSPPPNTYPPATSGFTSLPGSYPFPSQGSMYHPYVPYTQDHMPRPSPYPSPPPPFSQPGFSQPLPSPAPSLPHLAGSQSSLSQLNLRSPISSPPLDGARLMALLTTHSSGELPTPTSLELPPSAMSASENFQGGSEHSNPPAAIAPAVPSAPPVSLAPPPASARLPSSKLPRGRHLKGDYVVYDVDVRLPGETQPQLEVSPITVYGSDPVLVVGRQIAVNRSYICYGLRAGTIRILNINTALRALLRGHSQRVTDMAFFAEDVHLLASASSDGRIFVRKIVEDLGDEGKMQITEQILLAIQIIGDWESAHPRICWHSHLQDLLVVGIGKYVLTIDISKARLAAPSNGFTAEDPLQCYVDNPIEGVHCVGGHDGEVTDLSTSQWTHLASASKDGTVRIWGDKKMLSILTLTPHEGQPVGSVAFLASPHRPDQIVLLTAGPLNRELKLWVPAGAEGWLPQAGAGKWQCLQTLELKSSAEGKPEDAFFNQVLVVPRACLILLANAKKNAIYVVHVDFGSNPSATRMDYLAEFSVAIPILSLTATSENVFDGEGVVQVYCVQTQAIQQYSLDLSQCLPPAGDEPLLSSVFSLERDLISGPQVSSQVLDLPASSTNPPMESIPTTAALETSATLIGGRAKSPGPVSGVQLSEKPAVVAMGALFGGSVDLPSSRDQLDTFSRESTSMLDSKSVSASANKEVKEILTKKSLTSIPNIVAPAPQVGSVPVSPRGSPLARSMSKSPVDKCRFPFEETRVHELSIERKSDSAFIQQPDSVGSDSVPLSPRRIYEESIRKNEERDWRVSSPPSLTPIIVEQQANSTPVHLITPSELMSMVTRSKSEADVGLSLSSPRASFTVKYLSRGDSKPEEENVEVENVKVETKEVAGSSSSPLEDTIAQREANTESGVQAFDTREKIDTKEIQTDALDYSGTEALKESDSLQNLLSDQVTGEENQQGEEIEVAEERDRLVSVQMDETREQLKEVSVKATESSSMPVVSQSPILLKGRKNKNKTNAIGLGAPAVMASSSTQVPSGSATNIAILEGDSSNGSSIGTISPTSLSLQILAMQDSLNQLVAMQKELQKQMTVMVAVPVAKEGKRMEAALGQRMEKVLKAHVDAMWARIQEENAKREKSERERVQQFTALLSNSVNKDLPAALERVFKKEMSSIGPAVARLVMPSIEKVIPTSVNEAFQKGINEKGVAQLEKSVCAKLEAAVSRQLQSQFQSTGRQALQEALRSCFEGTVIPAFERSCRAMFEQVDAAFQNGIAEHTTHTQQQFAASHSALATTLQDTVASASTLAASLKGELADGQRKLLALVESAGASRSTISNKASNGGLPDKVVTLQHLEESLDPTIELSRLVGERKLEDAFTKALSLSDVAVVSWLCTQVDPGALFTTAPLPLSQGVLLSLVQQLGCDLGKDTARKLTWMKDAALALNPNDPLFAPHMRPVLEQVYQNLHRQMSFSNVSGEIANSMRLVIHVVNSLLTACK